MAASAAVLCAVAGAGFVLADTTSAASSGRFTQRGTVVRVIDGDTVDVRLTGGKRERVRLIGIDATEHGACFSSQASSRARALALDKQVVLRGDPTQDTRDRYGRLLAYVWLPGGKDLGYRLTAEGFAKVYVYRDVFQRHSAYVQAERLAKAVPRGLWQGCKAETAPQPVATPPPRRVGELPRELLAVPADRRRPRLCRRPRARQGSGPRERLGSLPARRRRRRLRLRVAARSCNRRCYKIGACLRSILTAADHSAAPSR